MTNRIVFTIEPIIAQPWGDSGQINGLSGTGIVRGDPVCGDDGSWLMFDTSEEAEAEALRRGIDPRWVEERILMVLHPGQRVTK